MVRLQVITIPDFAENNVRLQCLELSNNCYRNLSWQTKAWHDSTQSIDQKSLTDHKPKRIRKYDGTHVNIASYYYRFIHGRNRIMKACWCACTTHHRALHGMARQPTVRRHVCEAKHGKSKSIGFMEH